MKGILSGLTHSQPQTAQPVTGTQTGFQQTPLSGTAPLTGAPLSGTTQNYSGPSLLTGVTPLTGTTPLSGNAPYATTMEPRQVVNLPTIVQEKIIPQQRTEVQPVIHRNREQTEVHKIVQPLTERDIAPTQLQYATLPEETRQEVRMPDTEFQQQYRAAPIQPQTIVAPTQTTFFEKAPIIEETVHKKIIEEIQPVLYKEVVQPIIVTQTKPIHETVVETPRLLTEQMPMRDLGTRNVGGFQQPFAQQYNQPYQTPYPQQTFSLPYSTYPQQIGLPGLPPRDVRPSSELFGDNTGYGRSIGQTAPTGGFPGATGFGQPQFTSYGPPPYLGQQPSTGWDQQPSTGLGQQPSGIFGQQPSTGLSNLPSGGFPGATGQQPSTGLAQQPSTGLSQLPSTGFGQRGLEQPSLKEEILKVEYEVFNVEQTSTGQPFVERTVTKALEVINPTGTGSTGTFGDKAWEAQQLSGTGSNLGKASTITPP